MCTLFPCPCPNNYLNLWLLSPCPLASPPPAFHHLQCANHETWGCERQELMLWLLCMYTQYRICCTALTYPCTLSYQPGCTNLWSAQYHTVHCCAQLWACCSDCGKTRLQDQDTSARRRAHPCDYRQSGYEARVSCILRRITKHSPKTSSVRADNTHLTQKQWHEVYTK